MAPSPGSVHGLVAKNWKLLRLAAQRTSKYVQAQLGGTATGPHTVPGYSASRAVHQSARPARLVGKATAGSRAGIGAASRAFGTSTSYSLNSSNAAGRGSHYTASNIGRAVKASSGRSPFASTLRPNLTGGTLCRTAGGYGLGSGRIGGARYFSHTPMAPATVVQDVSGAIRAFLDTGRKVHYDGVDGMGNKQYKAVSPLHDKATKKMDTLPQTYPGSFIDYNVNPTITALTPMAQVLGFPAASAKVDSLQTEGLLDVLAADFSRALRDLAQIFGDLKQLATLGDLPITYRDSCLRVHFPGCDRDTVEVLANELQLQRGVIGQDPHFDSFAGTEMALLFPFAPSQPQSEASLEWGLEHDRSWIPAECHQRSREDFSLFSSISEVESNIDQAIELSSPEPLSSSEPESFQNVYHPGIGRRDDCSNHSPLEYQGFEGIYRFIEHYDDGIRG